MAKKRISVQSAKAKGRNLQQWACKKIAEVTGFEYGSVKDGDFPISSRPMGQNGTDVRLENQVLKVFPFSVECKAQESWGVHSWIEQAKANQLKNTDWIVIAKRKREKPVVILDAETFFNLLKTKV